VWGRIVNEEGKKLIIGVYMSYYRSERYQKSNVDNNQGIWDWITELPNKNIVLMGDMNYPDIVWDSRIGRSLNSQSLVDCLDDTFFTQHVQENTRGNARLDLVISKDPDIVQDLCVLDKMTSSDHNTILFKTVFGKTLTIQKRQMYAYNKANFADIRVRLKETIGSLTLDVDVDSEWARFKKALQKWRVSMFH